MQQLMQHPHSSPPPGRDARRGHPLSGLMLWAGLLCLGTAVSGCGADPELFGNPNSVQNTLSPACYTETQGGATSCKNEATWSAYGAMACAGKGAMMTSIKFATSCGTGEYRQATYECCTGTPPVPPPAVCMWAPAVVGVGTCLSPDAWKKEGITFCAMHGLDFTDQKLDRPCGMGGFGTAQFECCTKVPPPPPPPPPMCTAETLAAMSCVDDTTWKTKIEATCKSKMLAVGTVTFGKACMGGHTDVQFTCCGATPPPPPPMCIDQAVASMTCVDDVTWKTRAAAECAAKKLTLTGLTYGHACMGGHLDIQFQCCGVTPPPPPPTCTAESLASMSCVDDVTWKTKIEATCKAKMLTPGSVSFGKTCMGGHLDVQFTCCGPMPPPPPPPPMCTTETAASMSCVDDVTWKTRAAATCSAKKLTLGSLTYGHVCMGGHQDITFTCCGPTPPPPPPMCTTEKAPSTGTCHTPDQWKTAGEAYCSAKKESLTGLSMSGACMGGFSEASYECCPSVTPPPPPPTCTAGVLGDGRTCVAEAALKTEADGLCTKAGQKLTAFSPYDACGPMGQYLHAKYECCK